MPFYEYECSNCKYYAEVMQKITESPLRKCPSCGKNALKKLLSAPVFRLKGGGWYETDFKSDKEAKRNLAQGDKAEAADTKGDGAGAKAAEGSGAQPKGESKGDSKPAAAEAASASTPKTSESAKTSAPRRRAPVRKGARKTPARAGARKARRG
jgi:putative FmdB family regulatory protein